MWHLIFYRRRTATEITLSTGLTRLTPFRLLEHISGTEEEINKYWDHFVGTSLAIAAEITKDGSVVKRFIAEDEKINHDPNHGRDTGSPQTA